MRISDWSSDVCSSDLICRRVPEGRGRRLLSERQGVDRVAEGGCRYGGGERQEYDGAGWRRAEVTYLPLVAGRGRPIRPPSFLTLDSPSPFVLSLSKHRPSFLFG